MSKVNNCEMLFIRNKHFWIYRCDSWNDTSSKRYVITLTQVVKTLVLTGLKQKISFENLKLVWMKENRKNSVGWKKRVSDRQKTKRVRWPNNGLKWNFFGHQRAQANYRFKSRRELVLFKDRLTKLQRLIKRLHDVHQVHKCRNW